MIRGKLPIAFLCKFSLTPAKITAELESHQFRTYRQNFKLFIFNIYTCFFVSVFFRKMSSRIDDSRKIMRKKYHHILATFITLTFYE